MLSATVVSAAPVQWGAPFELKSASDLNLNFPVLYAVNAGDTTNNANIVSGPVPADPLVVTVGGRSVAFEGVEAVYGADASFNNPAFQSFGDAITHRAGQNYNVTFGTSNHRTTALPQVSVDKQPTTLAVEGRVYGISTGNDSLDVILNSQVFVDGRGIGSSALNIFLNNLVSGREYQVQLIAAADSRTGANVPSVSTLSDGLGNVVTGFSGFADLDGDGQAHVLTVLGRFTADGSSQEINAVLEARRNNGVSAVIVSVIPEPTALGVMLGAALLGLGRRR
jgi:hypothetical protein